MASRGPPEVDINLLEKKKLPKKSKHWEDNQLPIDILLLTVKDCEFLSCLSHLNPGFHKSYRENLGYVYFGDIGDDEALNLKIALIKCNEGSTVPGGSVVVVQNAVAALRPKAVFSVGYCGSLDCEKAKLGDVIVSAKLITYAPSKITDNGIEERGHSVPPKKRLANLIRNASDRWEAPVKHPFREVEVTVHRDGVFLSGPEKVQSRERCAQLVQRFPGGVAIEMEGEGLYTAAHDLEIEWIIIKGISEYADGSNSGEESWRRFASLMAASLTADILSDPIVFQTWPHYGDKDKDREHRPHEQPARARRASPTSRPQAPAVNVRVKTGSPSEDELEELSKLLGDNWDKLGRRLGFDRANITAFHRENEKLFNKAHEMLMDWKQREGSAGTYQVLYDALCHRFVGCKLIAEKICCA